MHELSIAQNIIDIVKRNVPDTEWANVSSIRLKIGSCAGIVTNSLEFSFNAIKEDSMLKEAKLEIESIPFQVQCNACNKISETELGFLICEQCGGADTKILSGTELDIIDIKLNEPMEK